jgi:hypothetical protein
MMYYSHPHASRVRASQSGGRQGRVHDVRSVTNIPSYFIAMYQRVLIGFVAPKTSLVRPKKICFKERKKPAHILGVMF